MDPALTTVFAQNFLIVVAAVIAGIQTGSVEIALVILGISLLPIGSYILSDGSILRTDATLYQSAVAYLGPQLLWFSGAAVLGGTLSVFAAPTASYLSLLEGLPSSLEGLINFQLMPFVENAFLIVLAALAYKFLEDINFSNAPVIGRFNESILFRLLIVALPVSWIFVELHGVRDLAFAVFAGTIMTIWVVGQGYEDLTNKKALPVLFTFMTTYGWHRANNIGSFGDYFGFLNDLRFADATFSELFWLVFIVDLFFFLVLVVGAWNRVSERVVG